MPRLPVLFMTLLLLACGGEEKSPPDTGTGADGGEGEGGGGGVSVLKVPPPEDRPKEPEPPPPVDPQAAMFDEAQRLMQSSDAEDRAQAIVVLKDAEDQNRAGRYVAQLLLDPDEDVRAVAAEQIGQFEYPMGAARIRSLLEKEESAYVRKAALQSLFALVKEEGLKDYVRVLEEDAEASVRAAAAGLIGRIGSEEAVEPLVAAVGSEFDEAVLIQALVALRKIGSAKATDAAVDALEYSGVLVRTEAARALGEIGDEKAVGPLVQGLSKKEDLQVLIAMVRALVKITGVADETMNLDDEATIAEQDAAIAAWKKWWEEKGAGD